MNITTRTWDEHADHSRWLSGRSPYLMNTSILDAHRFFYMFYDDDDFNEFKAHRQNPQRLYHGKAIQINLSISQGGKDNIDIVPWFRGSDNSTYMTIGMYTYDIYGYGTMQNFHDMKFILNESMVSSTQNDYDLHKAITHGTTIYTKELRDKPEKRALLTAGDFECAPSIPEPRFYTLQHQEFYERDIYCLTSLDTVLEYNGTDLFDDHSTVSIFNKKEMDTFEKSMKAKLYNLRSSMLSSNAGVNMFDSTDLSNYTLYHDFMTMQHGYTYIYDTQLGSNIIRSGKAFTPFIKYQFNDKLQHDIEATLRMIHMYARNVEKELGPVRLTFTPLYYGDKVDAFFKDWRSDNQPIIKQNVGVDNGSKLQNQIAERLLDAESEHDDDDYPPPPEGDLYH